MNRGSSTTVSSGFEKNFRFNEAPIHESGKWYVFTPRPPGRPGFNEAPIHESGK